MTSELERVVVREGGLDQGSQIADERRGFERVGSVGREAEERGGRQTQGRPYVPQVLVISCQGAEFVVAADEHHLYWH